MVLFDQTAKGLLSDEEETHMAPQISYHRIEPFGIEAKVDLAHGLTEDDKQELRRLYALEGLLLLRGLKLSMEDQMELCSIFGPVLRGEHDRYLISNVAKDGLFGDLELLFHHDIPYVPAPFLAGALHALEVSENVSGTKYASGLRAYERLPQKLRDRIDGLNALFVRPRDESRRNKLTDSRPGDNCAVQAVVQRQKGTGRPYVFVNGQSMACIAGLSECESDSLINELLSYVYAPDNIYEHKWKNGDIVIWDNLALQHARGKITGGVRTLQRVTIARFAYEEQYPADGIWFSDLQEDRGFGSRDRAA
jgi:taurine dioxygenase